MIAERVLFEDNHLLAVDKPAGWPSAHAAVDTPDTVDRLAKTYLRDKYHKPGNVFLGVVHRLDRPVTGCLVFARTSKAAARLSEQFRENAVEKEYWAIAELPARADWPSAGTFGDWLYHDDAARRVLAVPESHPGAKAARTHYEIRARAGDLAWLALRPQTGRKHQLRVQLAARGAVIYGDAKYGSRHALGHAVALHARHLRFLHPTRAEPVALTAPLPAHWRGRFAALVRGVPRDD